MLLTPVFFSLHPQVYAMPTHGQRLCTVDTTRTAGCRAGTELWVCVQPIGKKLLPAGGRTSVRSHHAGQTTRMYKWQGNNHTIKIS